MTEKELCGGKTFKEVIEEVEFHISDKQRIAKLEEENEQLKCDLYNTEANLQGMTINCENLQKENEELKNAVKLLIATLDDSTWDEGHPGYADSEPEHLCPNCSCKHCYRISCKYNESELFKKLYQEFPELYEK